MIRLFKNSNPFAVLLLAFLAAIPHIFPFPSTVHNEIPFKDDMFIIIFKRITGNLFESKSVWNGLLSTIIVVIEALALSKITVEIKLNDRAGFIPALSFILMTSLIPNQYQSYMLLVNGLLLIVIKNIVEIYKNNKANNEILLASFYLGIISGLGNSIIPVFIWLTISLFIMRPPSFREWMLAAAGFILPYYFLFTGLYLSNDLKDLNFIYTTPFKLQLPKLTTAAWIRSAVFLVLPIAGMIISNYTIGKLLIQARKTYMIIAILFFTMVITCLLTLDQVPFNLYFLTIPISVLISPLFTSFKKELIPNILICIILLLCFLR